MSGRKSILRLIAVILALSFLLTAYDYDKGSDDVTRGLAGKTGGSSDEEKSESPAKKREKNYEPLYDGHLDTVIMIYMVGSNLESKNGCATSDLHEICNAYKGTGRKKTGVRILVQTGGSKSWEKDFGVDPKKLQRYEVGGKDGLVLKEELKAANMSKPATLSDFIRWGTQSYPADRYGLILWDHGGGTLSGYGYDENYPGSMMKLQKMKGVFDDLDVHFDFVGFDACLMSTFETAYMLSPYADYMIASEEMEPGYGWYYTNWVNMLLKDSKTATEKLGKQIVDDFAEISEKKGNNYTLSVVNLKKAGELYNEMLKFAALQNTAIEDDRFDKISMARSNARSFGNDRCEQVDIIDFAHRTGLKDKDAVSKAVSDVICYFKTNMKGANGLAMYYPYRDLSKYDGMHKTLESLNFDKTYRDSLSGFCTVKSLSDEEKKEEAEYSEQEWYRTDLARAYEGETDLGLPECLDYRMLQDKTVVVDITPDQRHKMTDKLMDVWFDTGDGLMEIGVDMYHQNPEQESLNKDYIVVGYDRAWVTFEDNIVPFFYQDIVRLSDGSLAEYGYVPALLNDKDIIAIRVEFVIPEEGEGFARECGYWIEDEMETEEGSSIRNLIPLKEGDTLDFFFWVVDYEGNDNGITWRGDTITVKKDGITVGFGTMPDKYDFVFRYELNDVYGNYYYTEWLTTSDQDKKNKKK